VGFSVPRARAAMVSMIKFTQRSWTAVKGVPYLVMAPKKATTRATTLTVSWN
jgi:hypothetical protein